jgi:hypothetical protein
MREGNKPVFTGKNSWFPMLKIWAVAELSKHMVLLE